MTFSLISNLQDLSLDRLIQESEVILESVDKFLGNIYAILKNHKDPFGAGGLNQEELAAIITGLQILGKSDYRAGFDQLGTTSGFYDFLADLGEASAKKKFDDDHFTATDFLKYIGSKSASTVYAKNLEKVKTFAEGKLDEKGKEDFLNDVSKINVFYQKALQTLKVAQAKKQAADKSANVSGDFRAS